MAKLQGGQARSSMRSRAGAHAAGSGGDAAADGEDPVAQDPAGELNLIRSVLHMLSVRGLALLRCETRCHVSLTGARPTQGAAFIVSRHLAGPRHIHKFDHVLALLLSFTFLVETVPTLPSHPIPHPHTTTQPTTKLPRPPAPGSSWRVVWAVARRACSTRSSTAPSAAGSAPSCARASSPGSPGCSTTCSAYSSCALPPSQPVPAPLARAARRQVSKISEANFLVFDASVANLAIGDPVARCEARAHTSLRGAPRSPRPLLGASMVGVLSGHAGRLPNGKSLAGFGAGWLCSFSVLIAVYARALAAPAPQPPRRTR